MVSSQFWIPLTLEAHPAHQERGLMMWLENGFMDSEKVCQVVSVHSFPIGSWDLVSGAEIREL